MTASGPDIRTMVLMMLEQVVRRSIFPSERIKKNPHSSRYLPTIRASREPSSPSKIRLVAEELPLMALAFGKNHDLPWPLLLSFWHAGEYSTRTGVVSESVLALESGVEVGAPPSFLGHIL